MDSVSVIDTTPSRARRPGLAAVLSLLTVGLGHVYVAAPTRGLALWVFSIVLASLGLALATSLPGLTSLGLLVVLILAVYVAVAYDAARIARRQGPHFQPRWYNRWYVYAGILVTSAFALQPAVVRLLGAYVATAYKLPSDAMAPTLRTGDYVLAAPIRNSVARGRVVIHRHQNGAYIKRVAGLPGDTLEMRVGQLMVNGRATKEGYVLANDTQPPASGPDSASRTALRTWGPLVLAPDQYFVLGDNRDQSLDSRYIGPISRAAILAVPAVVYFSREPATGGVRWSRVGNPVL